VANVALTVPDLGGFNDIPVIEVLVKPGDVVKKDDPLVTLESDKATMEVPASAAGTIHDVQVKIGDKVSQGSVLATVEAAEQQPTAPPADTVVELRVPDIGGFSDIPVIEVLVAPGESVAKDAPLITLESDKATMEVPASEAGTIRDVKVKVGDKVSQGTVIATLATASPGLTLRQAQGDIVQGPVDSGHAPGDSVRAPGDIVRAPGDIVRAPGDSGAVRDSGGAAVPPAAPAVAGPGGVAAPAAQLVSSNGSVHASPAIRRFARELGVDLGRVRGSGPNARITRDDVQSFVKTALVAPAAAPGTHAGAVSGFGLGLPPWPSVDFAKYGPVERVALTRIQRISGPVLARNWVMIPHVTQNDDADVTELEAFRRQINAERKDVKVTMLAFLMKAAVAALKRYPQFNASLDGDELVLKKYYHLGFAADTPNGLLVPVIKDVDKKGIAEIAAETSALAAKARDGKLGPNDMSGATFTISSLGSIGGTYFTPIINAPEVAILGACKADTRPVWDGKQFVPRLVQPLSLSYDHRVIDGANAARFTVEIKNALSDLRRVLL
jgi:pyruvate dehydrogenase E2 component (dihydrolipoamide acetyltransferase)